MGAGVTAPSALLASSFGLFHNFPTPNTYPVEVFYRVVRPIEDRFARSGKRRKPTCSTGLFGDRPGAFGAGSPTFRMEEGTWVRWFGLRCFVLGLWFRLLWPKKTVWSVRWSLIYCSNDVARETYKDAREKAQKALNKTNINERDRELWNEWNRLSKKHSEVSRKHTKCIVNIKKSILECGDLTRESQLARIKAKAAFERRSQLNRDAMKLIDKYAWKIYEKEMAKKLKALKIALNEATRKKIRESYDKARIDI